MTSNNLLVERVKLTDENGIEWEIMYYVGTSEGAYSLGIERTGKDSTMVEETKGITHSYEQATTWLKTLVKGVVTPLSLHAIVDDLC